MYSNEEGLYKAIIEKASLFEINPARIALEEYGLPINGKEWWWNPSELDDNDDVYVDDIDLLCGNDDILTRFVSSIAKTIEFPPSTAMLHAIGVMSAAMCEKFFFRFNGSRENTVAVYTVGAQPPSTGKSGINDYLCSPIDAAYEELNKKNRRERAKLEHKLNRLKGAMKKASESEQMAIIDDIVELEEEIEKHPIYRWAVNDPTPEGCQAILAAQGGFFNVVSDESSAVKVILGSVYGERENNNGVFLHAWDNGRLSVARSSREGYTGRIRGAMAVLAQDASISAILNAGIGGEGVSERFMIIREPTLLGYRDHTKRTPINAIAQAEYEALARNIVNQPWPVYLTLSKAAGDLVLSIKQDQEPMMRDGGKYGTPMLRGVVGKNDKQIIKIACVFHVVKEWAEGGGRSKEVQMESVMRACMTFNQLLKTYVAAADSKGFTGRKTELNALISSLKKFAGKNKFTIETRNLRDNVKNTKVFSSINNLTHLLRESYFPDLEKTGHIVYEKHCDKVHINPHLR